MLFMPESPRYLLHAGRTLEAYKVFRRIRGVEKADAREEFFVMKESLEAEQNEINQRRTRRFPWLDFFTSVARARLCAWLERC
jgi:hypothetical protein